MYFVLIDEYQRKRTANPTKSLLRLVTRIIDGRVPILDKYSSSPFSTLSITEFEERDNEILNDIIELTAKLTILIVMLAKVASLEEFSLNITLQFQCLF